MSDLTLDEFKDFSPEDFKKALEREHQIYSGKPITIDSIVRNTPVVIEDFGWVRFLRPVKRVLKYLGLISIVAGVNLAHMSYLTTKNNYYLNNLKNHVLDMKSKNLYHPETRQDFYLL